MTHDQILEDFKANPYSYWAKKFDEVIHIPAKSNGTLCGSVAALLGNNYAPYKLDCPICPKCLKLQQ